MKHLLLLIPFLSTAQIQLSQEQVKFNYEKIALGREYKYRFIECQAFINELNTDISILQDSVNARNAENAKLRIDNNLNIGRISELSETIGKREKWFNSKVFWLSVGLIGGVYLARN